MMMMGLFFMKKVPFRKVYVHALVRMKKGQKMYKNLKAMSWLTLDLINLLDETLYIFYAHVDELS